MPVLSILDPSPLFEGRTASDALNETRALARAADEMNYRAFWLQEHHNATSFAGAVPEVQMADIASQTSRLTIGSGGIMLPNYSPLKVAEVGQMLNALYPGRIEIGLGRATGADPRTSAALLGPGAENFPQMLRMLLDWQLDASGVAPMEAGHRASGIAANPPGPNPGVWMLCSSASSAAFAGAMGLRLAFADFLNPGGATAALHAYREAFQPSSFTAQPYSAIGLGVLAAETEAEARHLASTIGAWTLSRGAGHFRRFMNADKATAMLRDAPLAPPSKAIVGTGEQVAEALNTAAVEAGADELILLTIAETIDARINSYRLIDAAMSSR